MVGVCDGNCVEVKESLAASGKPGTEELLAVASSIDTASFYPFVFSFCCLGYNLTSWYVLLFPAF
jgi:hypothetical protein